MFTQCPECETAFRITAEQLREGKGKVQCSKCSSLFDAVGFLTEVAFEKFYEGSPQIPTLPLEQALFPRPEFESSVALPLEDHHETRPVSGSGGWVAGIALMFVLMIGQIAFWRGDQMMHNVQTRTWFAHVCKVFGCELPDYRELSAIDVLDRSLQPSGTKGLEFRLVLANAARFRQPFPRIKLSLIDFNGEPVAQRVFQPEEIFPETDRSQGMAVGKPIEVRLELVNPGDQVGGYNFSLI